MTINGQSQLTSGRDITTASRSVCCASIIEDGIDSSRCKFMFKCNISNSDTNCTKIGVVTRTKCQREELSSSTSTYIFMRNSRCTDLYLKLSCGNNTNNREGIVMIWENISSNTSLDNTTTVICVSDSRNSNKSNKRCCSSYAIDRIEISLSSIWEETGRKSLIVKSLNSVSSRTYKSMW